LALPACQLKVAPVFADTLNWGHWTMEERGLTTASESGLELATAQVMRFVARQPILDARRNIFGYELLFRSGWENCFRGESEEATRQMLDNCLTMGIDALSDHRVAFINCTREALVHRLVTLLPPATAVLEILETVEPDAEVLEACSALRGMGYLLALDDFTPRPEMRPLVEMASFVKVDLRVSDAATRQQIHDMVRSTGAVLLAEKVETEEEFRTALEEGYKYFQGFFFRRPTISADRRIPRNQMNYVLLLAELARTPMDMGKVSRIVQAEASICYKLLRLANSALMGVRSEVTSVQSAIIFVGEDRFRRLVTVAVSSVLGRDQPQALVSMALERARFCELAAPLLGENASEQYMLGLLSLLDAILQIPMAMLVQSLPLRDEAKAALLGAANPAARPLRLIRCFEAGDWMSCAQAMQISGLPEDGWAQLYFEALKWAADAVAQGA
jgi:c-di-GMP-related signal transduction protein